MTIDLFNTEKTCIDIQVPDGTLTLYPNFLSIDIADCYFSQLMNKLEWKQEAINIYGKSIEIPRLSAWYADNGISYEYSGLRVAGIQWISELIEIKKKIESLYDEPVFKKSPSKCLFNSVLANLYRNGSDGVGWHSDDEIELGDDPIIASISLGEERTLQLKNKKDNSIRRSIVLPHGSLLIMGSKTQKNWLHQLPKSKKQMDPRINLTYRYVNSGSE